MDLPRLQDYGGTEPWTDDATPLRLLFDLAYVNGDHGTAIYPPALARLHGIQARWMAAVFPIDDDTEWMGPE